MSGHPCRSHGGSLHIDRHGGVGELGLARAARGPPNRTAGHSFYPSPAPLRPPRWACPPGREATQRSCRDRRPTLARAAHPGSCRRAAARTCSGARARSPGQCRPRKCGAGDISGEDGWEFSGGLVWWSWCLPIAAARYSGASDGIEESQAVLFLHLRKTEHRQ